MTLECVAMTDLLIHNGPIVTWTEPNEILEGKAILIRHGRVHEIGPTKEMWERYPDARPLDAKGQYVMPGNIAAHTHFYGAFARGMAIPGPAPKDFPDILERLWWRLDRALLDIDVKYSALVSIVDAIKHGTTTLIDHHASPNAIDSSLDQIADAADEAGVRAALCYEVTDRNGEYGAQAGITENVRFLHSLKERKSPLLAGTFGLHASLSLSDKTLEKCAAAAAEVDSGLHIHVAEHEADEYDSLYLYGKRTVNRLADLGILGPKSIVAHAVHVDPAEMEILRDSGTWVTHQPRSNMNNAVGAANVEGMLRMGIPVCLGNDGMGNAQWSEWKTAYLYHKAAHRDPRRGNGMDIVRMAIYNNTAMMKIFWPDQVIGRIEPGAAADIIFVDYHPFTPLTEGNLPWHIIFGFESSMVTMTMVNGKVLMQDRRLLTLDEEEIAARSRELAVEVWRRYARMA